MTFSVLCIVALLILFASITLCFALCALLKAERSKRPTTHYKGKLGRFEMTRVYNTQTSVWGKQSVRLSAETPKLRAVARTHYYYERNDENGRKS